MDELHLVRLGLRLRRSAVPAAVGAGLAVSLDYVTHHAKVGPTAAGAAVAIPVATALVSLWFLHDRPEYRRSRPLGGIAAGLVLLTPVTGHAVPLTGAILASLVAIKLVIGRRGHELVPRATS